MEYLRIVGGRPLNGTLTVQGSKNAVLPILAAALLTKDRCLLTGCPDISDVHTALVILQTLGCSASFSDGSVTLDAAACSGRIPPRLAADMRASVIFLGALLARNGEAEVPLPGGCVLGLRPLDLHLKGLQALGVRVTCAEDWIFCRGPVHGGTVLLRYPSVGATENLILAGCAAKTPVTILGAAREPEIEALADFLNACGAEVRGAGSSRIRIMKGPQHGCRYAVPTDRIAAATWLCAAAACPGQIRLRHVVPSELKPVLSVLRDAGCEIEIGEQEIFMKAGPLRAVRPIVTGPYPAFPTDVQAPMMAALLKAEGTTVFDETVFENRFRHVPALVRLGADIRVCGRIASVRGVRMLLGCEMEATDLRGGAAMLIAALSAEGESRILQTQHLRRGYAQLCQTVNSLGGKAAWASSRSFHQGEGLAASSRMV